jgi:vacuolar-type H+-ATPase subunit H
MLEAKTQEQHLIEEAQEKAKKLLEAAQKEAV